MWILTKDGKGAFDTSKMTSIYVSESSAYSETAVRCGFSAAQKDMTLGSYATVEQARAVLREILRIMPTAGQNGAFIMPTGTKAAALAQAMNAQPKERAADGKKPVRRGGS